MTAETRTDLRVVHRVVMPMDDDQDIRRLYLEGDLRDPAAAVPVAVPGAAGAGAEDSEYGSHWDGADREEDADRRRVVVPAGRRVSFLTYFNAFPAAYWRRWTDAEEVVLRVRVRGDATILVYRSNSKAHAQRLEVARVRSAEAGEHTFALPLKPFVDGGWYWLELAAGELPAVLEGAEWCVATDRPRGRTTIGITTFDRPDFCVKQLAALGEATELLDCLDEILVIDQGTRRVEDHPGFTDAAKALGGRLRIIEQANLGGSGGFARAMDETVRAGSSDYVLLLDDDVVTEPESILRAVSFADLARRPTIVGGHMFSLYDRSVLHAYGETLAAYRWFWGPAPHTFHGHDFGYHRMRETHWLHRRIDVDYNGWWMCLIPVSVIREIGLAMPMFIKWDDAEFGIRARAAGFPTVSLPGVAVWHVPWHDKDDTVDWQAYYHERNRLVSALLHSPYDRGGNLLKESLFVSIKHALSMQYSAAELMLSAIEDVLSGPGHMHATLPTKLGEIRELRRRFPDASYRPDPEEFPVVRRRPPRRGREAASPASRRDMFQTALTSGLRHLRPLRSDAAEHPQTVVPHIDLHWWRLSRFDSALVSAADGTGTAWYRRDPARYRSILKRTTALHARLYQEWPRLVTAYRAAQPALTSPESWRETFAAGEGRDGS
ncbi:glycosyltransferase family 2 protein [Actinomadura logoneensis]|uniref:Glycosyltransferase family 2 protein n=1 Tax=Actinomadura logoneensis TaxID=2293572 RepID=A0A372JJM1_9ACTN|nr:glycosyltransferase [Actinomadura logoneensis]RFU40129.1 glycosyltransferase family 2 protein [Actinomadura logoneensis]